jgi:histidine kinase
MIQRIDHKNVLHYGIHSLIFIHQQDEYGKPICIKVLNEALPSAENLKLLETEFEFSFHPACPVIRKAHQRINIENHQAIQFDYIEGQDLKKLLYNGRLTFIEKLKIAVDISNAMSEVHGNNIIHNHLCPTHILVEKITGRIYFINFSYAFRLGAIPITQDEIAQTISTFHYISPEQTGRINGIIDNRSDLYSLGAILYQFFTGILPFESKEPLELMFAHIAKAPVSMHIINEELPPVLSSIITKLLAKNPEDRYESASGLAYDLSECYRRYKEDRVISDFELATNDFSGKLVFKEKLYGREGALESLSSAFYACARYGRELVFIAGYAGSGKTSLVNALRETVPGYHGHYITGKFDQLMRDKPYSAFIKAFSAFIQHLIAGEQTKLSYWRSRIQEAISPLGKILTDLIPGLETLLGEQPPVPLLSGMEAQNRFHYVFTNFLSAVTSGEHPLVLFLDDLQWADEASFHLTHHIICDKALNHLMVICAYRDNETEANHPLFSLLNMLTASNISFTTIVTHALTPEQTHELVQDTLRSAQKNGRELGEIIYLKTKGNPFYIQQFLKSIFAEGLLAFDHKTHQWKWDNDKINEMNVSGNVVDLMTAMVQKLSADTLELLKLCSCIGNAFDLHKLSILKHIDETELESYFIKLQQVGFIISSSGGYRFAHDRIQQTIYSLISPDERALFHMKIGKMLSGITSEFDLPGRIFDIVDQWNLGSRIAVDEKTKNYIGNLNHQAGRKAMASSAHRQAYHYFDKAISLQPPTPWSSLYQATLDLHNEAAEAAHLCGEYTVTNRLVTEIITHSRTKTDCIRAHELIIQKHIAVNNYPDAIAYGLEKLDELGIHLPPKPGKLSIVAGLLKIQLLLFNKPSSYILDMPEMKDPEKLSAMRLLHEIASPAYFASPALLPLIAFKSVHLSVKYGLSPITPFAFNAYGFIQSAFLGNIERGIEYCRLAIDLINRLKAEKFRASTVMSYYVFFMHWKTHLPDTVPELEEAFRIGLQTGDYEYASYLAHNIIYHSFYGGISLTLLLEKAQLLDKQIHPFQQELTIKRLRIFLQSISNLTGVTENPWELSGKFFEETTVDLSGDSKNDIFFQNLYLQKTVLAIVFNKHDKAREFAAKAAQYHESVKGSALYPLFYFYQSLAITADITKEDTAERNQQMAALQKNISRLRKYENYCSRNYLQKRLLVEAEWMRVKGRKEEARSLYDQAIRCASENMLIDEALCWEKAGNFYMDMNEDKIAGFYLNNAAEAYHRWGAEGKVRQMNNQFQLADPGSAYTTPAAQHVEVENFGLDLTTVLKASTALSGEIIFSRLLRKLMQIIMENAGAQHGYFIMENNGDLIIQAESHSEKNEVVHLEQTQIADAGQLAISIVKYVQLTNETVIVEDSIRNLIFANDEFIRRNRPKSILCMPFINQGKLQGVIYLANNLMTGAFTEKRIALLRLLTGQIAVSIQNSLFYEELENKVQERTEQLRVEMKKSDDLLLNILPENVAAELKLNGRSLPRHFEQVAVLFTDFKDFTQVSEKLSPAELVSELDLCFRNMDGIVARYKLEKIKTIGDAYLCVSGLPDPDDYSITNTIKTAMDMLQFVNKMQEQRIAEGKTFFSIRIGIHTGPVVAGIVGDRKFAYDIWGDTVNTAARMEQSSEANRINISGAVYQHIKERFNCTYRGKLPAKNKGNIDMYFVEYEKSAAALHSMGELGPPVS